MTITTVAVDCPVCLKALPPDTFNLDYETYCPSCRSPLTAAVFPAFLRDSAGALAEPAALGAEAACFNHPGKKAVVPCDECGRFLCSLCQVEFSGRNWCPACIALLRSQGKVAALHHRRMLYDNLVLLLATVPLLVWPITLFTAPAALFLVFRYWRRPLSAVPRTRVRFVIAALIALIEIAGWAFIGYSIISAARRSIA